MQPSRQDLNCEAFCNTCWLDVILKLGGRYAMVACAEMERSMESSTRYIPDCYRVQRPELVCRLLGPVTLS